MSDTNTFEFTGKQKRTFLIMMVAGIIAVLIGLFAGGVSNQRFWSNLLVNAVFFTGISACAIFFLASHQIALAGWHITVKRIPEAMSQFTKIGGVFLVVIVIGTAAGYHHLYHWSDSFLTKKEVTATELDAYNSKHAGGHHNGGHDGEEHHNGEHKDSAEHTEQHSLNTTGANYIFASDETQTEESESTQGLIENPHYDKLLDGKKAYLNPTGFIIRTLLYLICWVVIAHYLRKASLAEDLSNGSEAWYQKSKTLSAIFLIIWAVSSSMMAWDWVMSLDPHWYSTLFGWYNFISLWVASLCTMILILVYLKKKGYMQQLNENHLHDIGKYVFGFSIFWTYLWFSQFMLIWYANLPEETAWFLERKREYYPLFYGNLIINFFVPFLVLMRRNDKRSMTVLSIVSVILIISHWNDFFVMIMPATVGADWHLDYFEIGMFLLFAGMFLYTVFYQLSKASLMPAKHPFFNESLDHHQ